MSSALSRSSSLSPSREIAFQILRKVQEGGYASDLLRRDSVSLESRDAALAESIVLGCLRRQSQLDFLIANFSGRPQPKLDEDVRVALRMGIFQLRYLDRIPAHAAVAESVELVKRARKRSAAGFVNAVLRKVDRQPAAWPDQATELSVPAWILARWQQQYGESAAEGIARAALEEPESYLNQNTGRQQDVGAQTIVPLLDIQPGMMVLDLCAAPGNKTAQAIAAGGIVVACDRYWKRLIDVPPAAARVVLDATQPLPFGRIFDRILVDAPCSGTGTLSGNPEIKWRIQPTDLQTSFQSRQIALVQQALACLKPTGILVYSTCSLEREENEDVIKNVIEGLATRDGSRKPSVEKMTTRLPGRDPGDGFFAAVITLQ